MNPTVTQIQRATAAHFGSDPKHMCSGLRARKAAWPRFVAMHIARSMTRHSLPQIGRYFGNRHHTSALHGVRWTQKRMDENLKFAVRVHVIRWGIEFLEPYIAVREGR